MCSYRELHEMWHFVDLLFSPDEPPKWNSSLLDIFSFVTAPSLGWGKVMFSVCSSGRRRGYPRWDQGHALPYFSPTPCLCPDTGTLPPPQLGQDTLPPLLLPTPPSWPGQGYTHYSPSCQPGQGYLPSSCPSPQPGHPPSLPWPGRGILHPLQSHGGCVAWAVYLLRSRRRTFLLVAR